jgi:hypothetical protein
MKAWRYFVTTSHPACFFTAITLSHQKGLKNQEGMTLNGRHRILDNADHVKLFSDDTPLTNSGTSVRERTNQIQS